MKNIFSLLLVCYMFCPVLGQGIFAGDTKAGFISNSLNNVATIEVTVFSHAERLPFTLIDWGDGSIDTLKGQSFEFEEGLFAAVYNFPNHEYQDTGHYTITYVDSFWLDGITNFDNSPEQLFTLSADIWLSSEFPFSGNNSVYLGPDADQILYEPDGTISQPIALSDIEFDSIGQKLIPVDAPGYYLPEATDSLKCCFIWDRPTAPGKYAFGFEFEDWRLGKRMGSIQRFTTVFVDTVLSSLGEQTKASRPFVVLQNPVDSEIRVIFTGNYLLDVEHILTLTDIHGRILHRKRLDVFDYGTGAGVDVVNYPPGLYLLTLEMDGRAWTEKVVVK